MSIVQIKIKSSTIEWALWRGTKNNKYFSNGRNVTGLFINKGMNMKFNLPENTNSVHLAVLHKLH
jgi:hypothetical protein